MAVSDMTQNIFYNTFFRKFDDKVKYSIQIYPHLLLRPEISKDKFFRIRLFPFANLLVVISKSS